MKNTTSMFGAALVALTSAFMAAVSPVPQASATLDEATRRAVVEAAAKMLRERYVFPDVADQAARAIESALRAGDYRGLDQPGTFAQRLTEDLRAVARDKHLRVTAPGTPAATSPPPAPVRAEGGVARADILDDNIGYIEVVGFPAPAAFNNPVDRAMAALQKTRALIVDVRRNGGGSPVSVSRLVSYFLRSGERVHINTFINRNPGTETFRSQDFWSETTPFSYAGKPVFVLTSLRTFSGGEEFAYDMQVMKLARIVGETTGGGANPGGTVRLAAGLTMFVPGGRAKNPITGTNWEGVGVTPDIALPSENALKAALEQLGVSPAGAEIETLTRSRVFEPNGQRTTP
jgi:Peptidase family S41/N-terminal domain of Peptidase_S41 in eukaryotic IRBP